MREISLKVLIITYTAVLFAGSLAPIAAGGLAAITLSGTVIHIAAYFFFALFLSKKLDIGKCLALAFAYGVLIEILQGFTGYRVMDIWDVAANGVGISIFYIQQKIFPKEPWNRPFF
ncbi:MAG: VanZ family protein [Candidatus Aenigmarchaeota archaeon]|nr:VanZ family protein [Candidatus Aenigmarchaeota archaeon]